MLVEVRNVLRKLVPGRNAWSGAALGMLFAVVMLVVSMALGLMSGGPLWWLLLGTASLLLFFFLAGGLLSLISRLFAILPPTMQWVLFSGLLVFIYMALSAMSIPVGVILTGLGILGIFALCGGGISVLARTGWANLTGIQRAAAAAGLGLGTLGLVLGGWWLLDAGTPLAEPVMEIDSLPMDYVNQVEDPSAAGPYEVQTLTYGSGLDTRRAEYGQDVDLVSRSVDGFHLVSGWSRLREVYWGFGADHLPLNARVWYPDGEGPFPLVLMLHGQHPMEDASEPGYTYLGELLAGRGFIAVSVDENFLNLSPLADLILFQSLQEADDLRAWLLLEHLQLWEEWALDPASPFYQDVNMEKIALLGHSRGGEAVAIAAVFNDLPYYPDDASLVLDYGFDIQSVIAIAPSDGMYQPRGEPLVPSGINYLVLQGAHDMDVFSFQGQRTYSRLQVTGAENRFKAAVYIRGANHGQFNSVWGRKDLFEPVMRFFNLEQLLPAEDQQRAAEVLVSAFLEATLNEDREYRDVFRDLRRVGSWLPNTAYMYQYLDSDTDLLMTFEEDPDLSTTTFPGGQLEGQGLAVWREQLVHGKWKDAGSQAVVLGWEQRQGEEPASYTITLPKDGPDLSEGSTMVFSMAQSVKEPDREQGADSERNRAADEPIDLTIELVDTNGQIASLPLSHFLPLPPQIEAVLGKATFMSPFPTSEAVFQHFEYDLQDFTMVNPDIDVTSLCSVRYIFNQTQSGVVLLDDFGFRP